MEQQKPSSSTSSTSEEERASASCPSSHGAPSPDSGPSAWERILQEMPAFVEEVLAEERATKEKQKTNLAVFEEVQNEQRPLKKEKKEVNQAALKVRVVLPQAQVRPKARAEPTLARIHAQHIPTPKWQRFTGVMNQAGPSTAAIPEETREDDDSSMEEDSDECFLLRHEAGAIAERKESGSNDLFPLPLECHRIALAERMRPIGERLLEDLMHHIPEGFSDLEAAAFFQACIVALAEYTGVDFSEWTQEDLHRELQERLQGWTPEELRRVFSNRRGGGI